MNCGNWERLPGGYALWTTQDSITNESAVEANASNASISRMLKAGLPNISGNFGAVARDMSSVGGFTYGNKESGKFGSGSTYHSKMVVFNASDGECGTQKLADSYGNDDGVTYANNVYGKSTTVQPPAYKVYAWKRIS